MSRLQGDAEIATESANNFNSGFSWHFPSFRSVFLVIRCNFVHIVPQSIVF